MHPEEEIEYRPLKKRYHPHNSRWVRMNRERITKEFKFMVRFKPLTLEKAKVICNTLEEYLAKCPFLKEIMRREGEAMLKETWDER